ncbi:MAG: phosphatase PAP2 family protein [Adlercreutzia sp.]
MPSLPSPSRQVGLRPAPVAVVLLVAAVVLAICRVLGGVHFPRDVVVGALIGSATGALAAFLAALL